MVNVDKAMRDISVNGIHADSASGTPSSVVLQTSRTRLWITLITIHSNLCCVPFAEKFCGNFFRQHSPAFHTASLTATL